MSQRKELTACAYYVDYHGRDILSRLGAQQPRPRLGLPESEVSSDIVTSESLELTPRGERGRVVTGENHFQGFSSAGFCRNWRQNVRGDAAEKYS